MPDSRCRSTAMSKLVTIYVCLFALGQCFFGAVFADVLKYIDRDGHTHYVDSIHKVPAEYREKIRQAEIRKRSTPASDFGRNTLAGRFIDIDSEKHFASTPVSTNEAAHREFVAAFKTKLSNPQYISRKNSGGINWDFQHFEEERGIKVARAKIAADMLAPTGISPISIPVQHGGLPIIDGSINKSEWSQAINLPMGSRENGTQLLLLASKSRLYLGSIVPKDVTGEGFDQFRFYFHINTLPELEHERVHVAKYGPATSFRQTNFQWEGEPQKTEKDRWKKFRISDSAIFKMYDGASAVEGYRQYEAFIDLQESGLPVGVPFPMWFEVETDPTRVDGKFKNRNYLGKLGSNTNPIWFVISPN